MFNKKNTSDSKEIQMQKYSQVSSGSPSFTIGDLEEGEDGDEEIVFNTNSLKHNQNVNENYDDENYSPEPTSLNIINRLTFQWMNSLLKKGKEKPLEAKDLPSLPLRDTSNYLYSKFKVAWEKQILISKIKNKLNSINNDENINIKHNPSLVLAFVETFGKTYFFSGVLKLFHDSLLFIGPNLLHSFIKFLADPNKPTSYGLTLVAYLFITNFTMSLLLRQYFWSCFRVGMNIRSAIITAIYTHALSLPPSLPALSLGSLTNLMSVDSTRLQDLTPYLHAIWYSVFQIILAIIFLYQLLSFATFTGVAVILCAIPLTKKVGVYMKTLQKELSKLRDERVRLMNEVLNGMKIIKLQAWEKEFENRILELRRSELMVFRKYSISQAFSSALFTAIPLTVAISTFCTYVALGNELDVATALTSLVLFELLRFPLFMFPQVMNNIVEAKVSVDRLQNFLCFDKKEKIKGGNLTESGAIIDNSSLVWQNSLKRKHLKAQEKNREITHRLENKIHQFTGATSTIDVDQSSEKINTLLDDQIIGSTSYIVDFNDPYYKNLLEEVEKLYLNEIAECKKADTIFTEENLEVLYGDATSRGSWSTTFLKAFHYITKDRFNSDLPDYELVSKQINNNFDKEDELSLNTLEIDFLVKEELLFESECNLKSITSTSIKPFVSIPKSQILTLTNLTIDFKLGNLYSIVGQVGSGKSSIIQSLLGNLRICTGKINVTGKIAYHPQVPFIMNATVRENILFGKTYDEKKYNETLTRCALIDDLKLLPNGDMCEIGEKGINLSGGQKARVSLARCFYSDHDIFLLDDPLSAVDSHVGNHLFHQCLLHLKEKGKCIILVTNALQYVKFSNEVVVLKEGKIVEQGNFNNIINSTTTSNLRDMINTMQQELQQHQNEGSITSDKVELKKEIVEEKNLPNLQKSDGKLMTTEDREIGDVDWKVYKNYAIAAGGTTILFTLIFLFGFTEFTSLITSWWLSYWSEHQSSSDDNASIDSNSDNSTPSVASLAVNFLGATTGATNYVSYSHTEYFDESDTIQTPTNTPTFSPLSTSSSSFYTSSWFFLTIYILLNLSIIAISLIRDFYLRFKSLAASHHFYEHLLKSLLYAPLSFYETTPLGRIINRASKDIYVIDEQLPNIIRGYLSTMAKVISVLLYIIIVTPVFIIALIILSLVYYYAQKYYISTSRELTRIESTARSPIYALFGESLEGLSTIHAYSEFNKPKVFSNSKDNVNISDRLLMKNAKLVDNNQVAYMLNFSANCWLAVRLEFVGTLIVTFAALFAVLNRHRILTEYEGESSDELSDRLKAFSGFAGLSVSLALSVTQSLNWTVRMASDLESMMISTERVQRYAHHLQQEADHFISSDPKIETKTTPNSVTTNVLHASGPNWPNAGHIEFRNVYMRYRPHLPCVLKGVSLIFTPSIKVGVVGRTGAGKSTLLSALLRLVEIDPFIPLDDGENGLIEGVAPSYGSQESKIFIDGKDISKLGLHCLRRSISVIPQDPVLFSGNIRKNLDPFEEYSESKLIEVLNRTLWISNNNSDSTSTLNLDSPVTEGGSNLSVGQRQLLCIARALLAHSKIIVMDEATAAVDVETDSLIQKTIRTEFAHATTITVAHRLNTIMDSDKVLVMDKGRVGEYDTPANLLNNSSSLFYHLVHNWEKSNE